LLAALAQSLRHAFPGQPHPLRRRHRRARRPWPCLVVGCRLHRHMVGAFGPGRRRFSPQREPAGASSIRSSLLSYRPGKEQQQVGTAVARARAGGRCCRSVPRRYDSGEVLLLLDRCAGDPGAGVGG